MHVTINNIYRSHKHPKKYDEECEEAYLPNILHSDGHVLTNNSEKAEYLLPRMILEAVSESTKTPDFDLTPIGEAHEVFAKVTRSEVKRLFRRLKKGKSTMDGDVPNEMLKICADELLQPSVNIVNATFALGHRPEPFS